MIIIFFAISIIVFNVSSTLDDDDDIVVDLDGDFLDLVLLMLSLLDAIFLDSLLFDFIDALDALVTDCVFFYCMSFYAFLQLMICLKIIVGMSSPTHCTTTKLLV